MSAKIGLFLFTFALLTSSSLAAAEPALAIRGEVKIPLRLSLSEIKSIPVTKVRANDHNGATATYEGVSLAELLQRAGVPQGGALRGDALRLCVIVKAMDGYQALFALAELDPAVTDKIWKRFGGLRGFFGVRKLDCYKSGGRFGRSPRRTAN